MSEWGLKQGEILRVYQTCELILRFNVLGMVPFIQRPLFYSNHDRGRETCPLLMQLEEGMSHEN